VFISFKQLTGSLATYEGLLADQLAGLGIDLSGVEVRDLVDTEQIIRWATGILTTAGGLVGTALFIIWVVLFAASEANGFYTRLVQSLGASNPLVLRTGQFTQTMVRYVAMRALINLITGGLVALVLLIMGIDFALLWGVLTFFLSFIPYIGIFVATVPSVVLAFAQYGLVAAILVIVAVTVINVTAENLVAPKIIGKGLSISPLVVFLSFFFWSWVLGGPGMLLAMPLTVLVIFILQGFEETQWLAAVAGSPATPLPATEANSVETETN
jgi:predicted PurR-regulated permease PerM